MEKTIYIKDYISLPCSDAAEGIRKAFEKALEIGAAEWNLKQAHTL